MCRLAAYLGEATSPEPVVFGGPHSLFRQSWAPRELLSGSVNADGYGVAWYGEAEVPGRIGSLRPIWQDEAELKGTLGALRSRCIVAALRNGTPGIPVDRAGILPLVLGRWAFVLNGFVPDFRAGHMRALRASLPDTLYAALRGSSDSETLFLLAVAELERGASLVEALRAVVTAVARRVRREKAQLNMVLTDGSELVAARSGTAVETNSLYVARGHPLAPGGVLLASERFDAHPLWDPVDGHTAVTVAADGSVAVGPFEV